MSSNLSRVASTKKRFSRARLKVIHEIKYFRIRAGEEHRMIAVWVVVVEGRVLVRSWNDKPTGWYRAFVAAKRGAILVDGKEIVVRASKVRSASVLDAIDEAYAAKYDTKPNAKYVEGFRDPARRACTLELVPA